MPSEVYTDTVNCFVFRQGAEGVLHLLLLKSTRSPDDESGHWQAVSGKREPRETCWQAAIRELSEETGRSPERLFDLGVELYYDYRKDRIHMHPSFAAEVSAEAAVRLSGEHDEFVWADAEQALRRLFYPGQRALLQQTQALATHSAEARGREIPREVWLNG